MADKLVVSPEGIITIADVTEYIELPPFYQEDLLYCVIPIEELVKLDNDEELKILRYDNNNSKFMIKYNVSGSIPIGYETIETKSEYNWEEIQNVMTSSEWVTDVDLSVHEFEASWVNPEFEE